MPQHFNTNTRGHQSTAFSQANNAKSVFMHPCSHCKAFNVITMTTCFGEELSYFHLAKKQRQQCLKHYTNCCNGRVEKRRSRREKKRGHKDRSREETKDSGHSFPIVPKYPTMEPFTSSENSSRDGKYSCALTLAGILAGWFSSISLFRCRIHMRLSCCDLAWGGERHTTRRQKTTRTIIRRLA